MSSIIVRQQLSECLLAISSDVNQIPAIEALPDESSSLDPICLTAERLSRKLNQAQTLLQNWTVILSNPVKEIREEEIDLFSGFVVDNETPSEVMSKGSDVQTRLDLKIDRIRARANQSTPNGAHPNNHARPLVNLPALQLPDFDGHEENWPSFWAAFSHTIHDNSALTGAQKLTYLVGRLRGNSRALIDGFALTDHNYPIVIDLLKSRFGDDQKRADRLRSELFHLAKPSGHSNSLRIFSENVDRICRQLESLGNNLDDNPFLTVAIKEKLPTEVKAQLYDKEMEDGTPWSSKQWRERLVRVVCLREAIHAPWDISAGQTHPQLTKPPPRQIEPIKRAFPVIAEPRKGILKNCSLCLREGHQPFNCMVYRSTEQRITRLTEQGRCLICAREGHRRDTCSSTVLCFRCGGNHHVWICPEQNKVPIKGSNSIPLGRRIPVVGGHNGERPNSRVSNPVVSPSEESITTRIVSAVSRNDTFESFSEQIPEKQT
uniref:Uncharacterized protein n=1 Tax=Globodera rostochiensis TaxID=31243 RepID=A0A914H6K3_GLORO